MSIWHEVKKEDIDIDKDELNLYLYSDENGAVYATVKITDIKEILNL